MKKDNVLNKTIHGVKWNYISVIVTSIFQLIHTAILSRLLDPAAFGLLAMANTVLRFGAYFSRMGIGSALIQKPDVSEEDIRAGFTLSVGLGAIVSLIIVLIAPLAKFLFDSQEVIPVIRVYALTMFINGFSIVSVSLLRRRFRFRELFISELVSYFIGSIIVGISLAFLDFGVWSLIFASIVQVIVLAIIAIIFSRHSIKPIFFKETFNPLVSFGSRVSLISFIEYLNYNLDTILIGRFLGESLLGIYNRAYHIISLPTEKITTSLTRVLFSSFSEIQINVKNIRQGYLISLEIIGLLIFPFAFSISGAAKEVVLIILGDKWIEAIPVLRILSLAVAFILLSNINGILFEAMGWLNEKIKLVVFRLIFISVTIFLAARFGLVGILSGIFIVSIIFYFIYMSFIYRKMDYYFRDFSAIHFSILISGIIAISSTYLISYFGSLLNLSLLIILILQIIMGGLIVLFFTYIHPSKSIVVFFIKYIVNSETAYNFPGIKMVKKHYKNLADNKL